jgi:hypothetical protein
MFAERRGAAAPRTPSAEPNSSRKRASFLGRRNNFTLAGLNLTALGVRPWGDVTMTESESWKERWHQVERYRVLAQEITDPLAAGLLRDIVFELEADLNELAEIGARRTASGDYAREPGVLEFHGRTVSCFVRDFSESGAALDVVSPSGIPERFVLSFPWERTSHRCRLVWRSEAGIGVTFQ